MSKDQEPSTKTLSDSAIEGAKAELIQGIGYKRPPQQSRFKKGQSGNPKGRPRSDRSAELGSSFALTLKEAERLITVREGDQITQIPTIEAVLRAQSASALKGSAYAQKHMIESYRYAERARRSEIEKTNEAWIDYVRKEREAHAHAARNGLPVPTGLPHPDDVVIDPERGVSFIGPWDAESAEGLRHTLLMRDVLIMQDVLQKREDEQQPNHEADTAIVVAMRLNEAVPQRHRLSDIEWVIRLTRLQGVPKRELRKRLAIGWAELGIEWKPDLRLPTLSYFTAMVEQLIRAVHELERTGAA